MGRGWSCRVSGLGWVLEDPWLCAGQNSRAIVKWRQVYLDRYTFNWGFPDSLLGKESACNARDSGHAGSIPGSGRSPGEGLGNPLQYSWAFPGGTVVKNLPTNAEDARGTSLIPGWWRSPGVGHDNPFQYYYLENSINRRAWQSMGSQRVRHNWVYTHTHTHQYSCLKSSMDRSGGLQSKGETEHAGTHIPQAERDPSQKRPRAWESPWKVREALT